MSQQEAVVIADFDSGRLETYVQALAEAGFQLERLDNGADLLDRCRSQPPKVAVVEALLPRKNGFEVLKALKEDGETAAVKVIMLLDEGDTYGEHRARLCGADIILSRPFTMQVLAETVRSAGQAQALDDGAAGKLGEGQLEDVIHAMEGRARAETPLIEHITDPLTGLFNAPYTELKLADEVKKVRRFYHPLTCVLVGIDDARGLEDPDSVPELRKIVNEMAGILLCESRDIDHLARFGPLEFVCLLPHTDTPGGVCMVERILASIANRDFRVSPDDPCLTASGGVATFSGSGMDATEELIARAREALVASRQWGGNRCTVWAPGQVPEEC